MSTTATDRRKFLSLCTSALMVVIGLLVAVPALAYLLAPLRKKLAAVGAAGTFHDVGRLADFPVGEWRSPAVEVEQGSGWTRTQVRHGIWVRRQGPGEKEITVLSSICPHLGCPVNWNADQAQFHCPCHGGVFQNDGSKVAGPPPRPMDQLDFEVRGDHLWVRWQDFKIGVAERIPVSG